MAIDPDKQLPGPSDTVNERFFDAMVRHQVGLLRLSGSIRNQVFKLLNDAEPDLRDKIRSRLANATGLDTPADVRRMETLLKVIRADRLKTWDDITEVWVRQMRDLARTEPAFVDGALKTVVPVQLDTVIPSAQLLSGIVTSKPFQGKTLRSWAQNVRRADLDRIESQIRIGMVQGESSQEIARRVVGTVRQRGRDGVTELTRRQAAAITRTAVIGISSHVRREYYEANKALFREEIFTATLDSRTTPICQSLDGTRHPVGEGPIPPMHIQCRSLRVAALEGEALGTRPARNFTEQRLLREFTGERGLDRVASRAALPRGFKGDFDKFRAGRIRELTGRVPAKVTYQQWLQRQPASFQDDVLGQVKGRLFRRGKLKLDRFVNRSGDELSLSQLARREADAFRAAGLDPEDFL